ncbi:MAG: nuclear export factor [Actinomycetia bacterium]|nr:nuclear export factor [Actinomycetes bacterium]
MRRIAIVFAAAGVALVAAAAPAWAHVKVEPESAVKGSDAVLAFVVPNEKTNATTNKVVVQFPTDHPIADALTEPIPGWTAEVTTAPVKTPIKTDAGTVNDAVKSVTWTAAGPGIGVGNFQEFRVSVGLPADADSLTFPTTQTYTDGETVNWVQVTPPGGPEPDSPAPVLTLTNAAATADTTPTTGGTAASNVKKSDVDNAKTIAIIGIVVGALGLLAGIGGLTMARRKAS